MVFPVALEGRCMDYNEVSSAFSKLVETHFVQRCPPQTTQASDSSTPASPSEPVSTTLPTPESFPDCYKVPPVTLIGRGKRPHSSEDGEDQRNAKRAKLDPEVRGFCLSCLKIFSNFFLILNTSYQPLLIFLLFCLDTRWWGDLLAGEFWEVPSSLPGPGHHQCCSQQTGPGIIYTIHLSIIYIKRWLLLWWQLLERTQCGHNYSSLSWNSD